VKSGALAPTASEAFALPAAKPMHSNAVAARTFFIRISRFVCGRLTEAGREDNAV
jgi:hypothetical protein